MFSIDIDGFSLASVAARFQIPDQTDRIISIFSPTHSWRLIFTSKGGTRSHGTSPVLNNPDGSTGGGAYVVTASLSTLSIVPRPNTLRVSPAVTAAMSSSVGTIDKSS